MMVKCPMCGAPMQDGMCGYCGYTEKKEPKSMPYQDNALQQPMQQQAVQPQIVQPQVMQSQVVQPQMTMGGQMQMGASFVPGVSKKSKGVALLLCIFLGCLGAHKFYVGKIGSGILYLFTLGFFGIGWFIDIILIIVGAFKDEFGLPLKN